MENLCPQQIKNSWFRSWTGQCVGSSSDLPLKQDQVACLAGVAAFMEGIVTKVVMNGNVQDLQSATRTRTINTVSLVRPISFVVLIPSQIWLVSAVVADIMICACMIVWVSSDAYLKGKCA